jgi:hypothetical protein
MKGFQDIKVVLQTPEGKYLSGSAVAWRFTEDRARAIVFDLFGHRVQEQLALLREQLGFSLEPVCVPPREIYEACDACQRLLMPGQIFYDGQQFLCFSCKAKADAKPLAA